MEPFFDSCGIMRDVMISIMATLAEQERINISDRTKAGLERARKAGRVPGPKRADIDMDVVRKRQAKGESLVRLPKRWESVRRCWLSGRRRVNKSAALRIGSLPAVVYFSAWCKKKKAAPRPVTGFWLFC